MGKIIKQITRFLNFRELNPEETIKFLEDDSTHHGSGYVKEKIWHHIPLCPLNKKEIQRIEQIAIQYIHKRMSREFRYMCKAMSRIASSNFWKELKKYINSENQATKTKACILMAYSKGIEFGEKFRNSIDTERIIKESPKIIKK